RRGYLPVCHRVPRYVAGCRQYGHPMQDARGGDRRIEKGRSVVTKYRKQFLHQLATIWLREADFVEIRSTMSVKVVGGYLTVIGVLTAGSDEASRLRTY